MLNDQHDDTDAAVGRRVRVIRKMLDRTQDTLALELSVVQPLISGIEKGEKPLTHNVAINLSKLSLVSLDWIFFGNPRGLDQEIIKDLVKNQPRAQKIA